MMTVSTSATTSTTTTRRKKPREATVPTRRSSRVLGTKPTHDGSAIDALEEEEEGSRDDEEDAAKANGEDSDDELIDAPHVEEWLAEAREKLLATRATNAEGPKGEADDAETPSPHDGEETLPPGGRGVVDQRGRCLDWERHRLRASCSCCKSIMRTMRGCCSSRARSCLEWRASR